MKLTFTYNHKEYTGEYSITEDKKYINVSFKDDFIIELLGETIVFTFDEKDGKYHFGTNPNLVFQEDDIYSSILYTIINQN
jgi:hypothetical protein